MTIDQIIKVDIAISEAMAIDGGYDTILIIGPLPKTPGGHMTPDVAGYTGTQDLKSAGFSTDDPVYISASKVFSQSPKPSMVMVAVQKTTSGSTEKVDVTLDRAKAVPGWYCIARFRCDVPNGRYSCNEGKRLRECGICGQVLVV